MASPDIDMASVEQDSELVGTREATSMADTEIKYHAEHEGITEPTSITGINLGVFGDFLSQLVRQQIVAEHPWVKTDAINTFADDCSTLIQSFILEQEPQVEATKSHISFMSLSPELRELIYDLALVKNAHSAFGCQSLCGFFSFVSRLKSGSPNVICAFKRDNGKRHGYQGGHCGAFDSDFSGAVATQPALTQVSRQIRAETLPIFYAKNTFVVIPDSGSLGLRGSLVSMKKGFLTSIGSHNAGLIKQLKLLLVGSPEDFPEDAELLTALTPKFCGLSVDAVEIWHHHRDIFG